MKILVTGALGQLGSHIRLNTAGSRHRYFFTDVKADSGDVSIPVEELDICRRDAVMNFVLRNDINVVINCAAYTNVDRAEEDEETAERVNATAVRYLADAMKVSGGKLIHISTDYVFGGGGYNRPIREEEGINPTGAYGRTKLKGEMAIAEVGCRAIVLRTAWMYSEYGNNFVKTMLRLFGERDEVKVVFDQVGTPTYAGDLAKLICAIVEDEGKSNAEGVYHFTDEGVCSWYDFACEIARQGNQSGCKIVPCHSNEFPSKVVRPWYSVLDKSKVKETFGIEIPHWTEPLAKCVNALMCQ